MGFERVTKRRVRRMSEARVAPEGVDAVRLGARIRALRESRGVSLRSVARSIGVSPSAVSQMERGLMRPSVNRLLEIVSLLDGSLSEVLEDAAAPESGQGQVEGSQVQIHRAGDGEVHELASGVSYRRLAGSRASGIDYFESTYPPDSTADATGSFVKHEGREVGLVLSGRLTVEVEDEVIVLGPGDTIVFASQVPHRLSNHGAVPAVANWMIIRGLD